MSWINTSDTTMNRPGLRDYELEIIVGELYEVWLHHDWEEPKPCVPVIQIATDAISPNWEVLVDGQVKEVHADQIFRSGTATRPNPPFTMPIIKNTPAPLFVNDIVKVQPMTMPVSGIFYMDYKFGEEKK
jgi:hypothetical protein